MSKGFSERILEFVRQPEYRPMKARRLAQAMGVAEAEYGDFHDAVDSMRRVGRVVLSTDNAVTLPHPPNQVTGTFRGNARGFGFVVPDGPTEHGDLFIPPGESLDAVTGDRVSCVVQSRGQRDGKAAFGGRVIKIVERGENKFVGKLQHDGGIWFVQTDGNALHVPILIGDPTAKGARAGDQVVVEIVRYPSEGKPAKGVIVERLGKAGQPGVDVLSIIHQFHLPHEFDEEILREVRAVAKAFKVEKELERREDLSDRVIVTIDPDDAKDFDDAISLERLDGHMGKDSRGGVGPRKDSRTSGRVSRASGSSSLKHQASGLPAWELGVHIADVCHFVKDDGPTDTEARLRGTSVYLPRHVIPMLPEILSNGLCSLQEAEPRLCKSAFIQYDAEGNVVGARFANTVIRSTKRLTYKQAQAILDGSSAVVAKRGDAYAHRPPSSHPLAPGSARGSSPSATSPATHRLETDPKVVGLVQQMDTLARIIQRRRVAQGMISLELPEVELILDDDGRVIDARPEDMSFTHTIIEMFMVEANEAVARLLDGLGVPFIRRIHPEPDEESLESMAKFMRAAGFAVPKKVTPGDLQALLGPLKGRKESYAINLAVLKSMESAEYSPKHVGHFALASKCYGHFTSPIRRYADLTVHRLLQRYLEAHVAQPKSNVAHPSSAVKGSIPHSAFRIPHSNQSAIRNPKSAMRTSQALFADAPSQEELEELGRDLSYKSRRAESAESELKTLKVLELLAREHVGEEFEGVVTGVTNFGLFVQHPKYLIDGLLRLEDLGDDWWEVDLRAGRVMGERTRQSFMMGTLLEVRLVAVDLAARQMKLALIRRKSRGGVEEPAQKPGKRSKGGRRGKMEGRRAKSFRKRGRGRR